MAELQPILNQHEVVNLEQELLSTYSEHDRQHMQAALRRKAFFQARTALINQALCQQFVEAAKRRLTPEDYQAIWAQLREEGAVQADILISAGLGTGAQVFLRELADAIGYEDVLSEGVTRSVQTLNEGVVQYTDEVQNPETRRKHRARLRAALHAMADALGENQG